MNDSLLAKILSNMGSVYSSTNYIHTRYNNIKEYLKALKNLTEKLSELGLNKYLDEILSISNTLMSDENIKEIESKNVKLNETFVKAVENRTMWQVYEMIVDSAVITPSLIHQDAMIKYAEEKIPDLYQKHDGEKLSQDKKDWTKDYYKDQKVRLERNFSKERLDLFRKMTQYIYKDTIEYDNKEKREELFGKI